MVSKLNRTVSTGSPLWGWVFSTEPSGGKIGPDMQRTTTPKRTCMLHMHIYGWTRSNPQEGCLVHQKRTRLMISCLDQCLCNINYHFRFCLRSATGELSGRPFGDVCAEITEKDSNGISYARKNFCCLPLWSDPQTPATMTTSSDGLDVLGLGPYRMGIVFKLNVGLQLSAALGRVERGGTLCQKLHQFEADVVWLLFLAKRICLPTTKSVSRNRHY